MVMKYLNKAGKYIYNNRILLIICIVAAFIIMANIASYITNYEYYGNKKESFTNNTTNTNNKNNSKNNFMAEQMKNMKNKNNQ